MKYRGARDGIVKSSITVVGDHVLAVDMQNHVCKLVNGHWLQMALANPDEEPKSRPGRKRYSGHGLLAPRIR